MLSDAFATAFAFAATPSALLARPVAFMAERPARSNFAPPRGRIRYEVRIRRVLYRTPIVSPGGVEV